MISRTEQLDYERARLAGYAVLCVDSRGRGHAEPEHVYRTAFQRDRDRIVHSSAFRRLEAKTQVFTVPAGDYYRTRLTHTFEVSLIARTMARALAVNEDLAEAAALAHDLGHPPYGHCGEAVLNELMSGHGGFEHNRHSLRVVDYLEHPYPDFRGLNLSYETRWCIAKHETRYDRPELSEEFPSKFAPLEGQLADLADSIAYTSHDLDDALAGELICEDDLKDIELYQELLGQVGRRYPQARRFSRQLRCAKGIIELLARDALAETARNLETLKPESLDDIVKADDKVAGLSAGAQERMNQLSDFLLERVYHHPRVVEGQSVAKEHLEGLFRLYCERPELLPVRYQQRQDSQPRAGIVCDYLAGMTDSFCREQYHLRRQEA